MHVYSYSYWGSEYTEAINFCWIERDCHNRIRGAAQENAFKAAKLKLTHIRQSFGTLRPDQRSGASLWRLALWLWSCALTSNGVWLWPIDCIRLKISLAEKKYSQLDKEGLAIIFGVKHFYQYLYGRHITVPIRPQATAAAFWGIQSNPYSRLCPHPGGPWFLELTITTSSTSPESNIHALGMQTCSAD